MDVLIHISQQLSNSTTPAYSPADFAVSPSIAAVNVLFFLSLALVLIDAFLAMLVKGWLQEFDRSWRKYTVAAFRAQERERRLQALEHWKLAELVTLLPILIQISLLLFCIGLIVLLFPIHLISAIFSSVALMAGLSFYLFTTYVSIIDAHSPFPSPVSHGLVILVHLITHSVQHFNPGILFRTSRPSPPQEHKVNPGPTTESLPGNNRVSDSSLPQGNMGVEKQETITRSHSQIDPQTYLNILERLATMTAKGVENIPVFLDLLDQPVKDPRLRPASVEKWKELLRTTLGLLGDPSTFSDSVARTIARSVMFWYDRSADDQLSRNLIHHFDHMCSGQTSKHKPLNYLFAPYLSYCCDTGRYTDRWKLCNIIAFLEPSNATDLELLWMINTIRVNFLAFPRLDLELIGIFVALLTYVSCTDQSRRSQVPLTAAIIHAMYAIRSASNNRPLYFIGGPYVLPRPVLTTSESMSMTFHQVDALDLWSEDCVKCASALLQSNTLWVRCNHDDVWKFQLALIAALYIDSTKQAGRAGADFRNLLSVTEIPVIKMTTWGWADAYDQTRLAGYWYTAIFQRPIYYGVFGADISPVQDIRHIITQTIRGCSASKMRLSALHLLDFSVDYWNGKSSSLSNLLTIDKNGVLHFQLVEHITDYIHGPFNPWFLLHLDTLFSPGSFLHQRDLEQLEWTDTPEKVHIGRARLALYNSLQGEGDKGTKQLNPELALLNLFLRSKDYAVCTGAFKCCLDLASQPSSSENIQSAAMFIPGTMECQWIEHLIRVLCEGPWDERKRSWKILTEHLPPKWDTLPLPWRCDFASAFLSLKVNTQPYGEGLAYQGFANSLRDEKQTNQAFILFLGTMLQDAEDRVTWGQLNSLTTWLAQLPEHFQNQDAHVKLDNIVATRKKVIVDETLQYLQNFQCHIHYDV